MDFQELFFKLRFLEGMVPWLIILFVIILYVAISIYDSITKKIKKVRKGE